MNTVLCVSTHPEDLADGRLVGPGQQIDNIDLDQPHNARLVVDGRLVVLASNDGETPTTVEQILDQVGQDPEKAQAALLLEQASAKPRKTLVEPLEAIVAAGQQTQNPDEEVSP